MSWSTENWRSSCPQDRFTVGPAPALPVSWTAISRPTSPKRSGESNWTSPRSRFSAAGPTLPTTRRQTRRASIYAAAQVYLEESLAIVHEFGEMCNVANVVRKLGRAAQHQGKWNAAAGHFTESLAVWQQVGNKAGIAACLEGLGAVANGQGAPERAARLLGAAAALRESCSLPIPPIERSDRDGVIAAVRSSLGETVFAVDWAAGRASPLDQAIFEALHGAAARLP
jgi:hypothetical protein